MTTPQLAVGPLLSITLPLPLILIQATLFAAAVYCLLRALTAFTKPRTATRTRPLTFAIASLLLLLAAAAFTPALVFILAN